ALENCGFFVEAVFGKENGDGFADHFLGGVAEDSGGCLVPTADDAAEVFGDDGIVGGVDDGGEEGIGFFGRAELWQLEVLHGELATLGPGAETRLVSKKGGEWGVGFHGQLIL